MQALEAMKLNFFCLLLLSLIVLIKSESGNDELPNIIFILADDLGFADVGYNQEDSGIYPTEVVTHNIDNLAKYEGLILTRHYTHYTCTPTRSSIQSGRLPTHVEMFLTMPDEPNMGLPRNMSAISSKFLEKGYLNYMVGKWDVGMSTFDHTPKGRGYNESLFYFSHENEYWNQKILSGGCYNESNNNTWFPDITDLWESNGTYEGPAFGLNGTAYEEFIFAEKVFEIINKSKDLDAPFYLYYAPHATHAPLQVPKVYYENHMYPDDESLCSIFTPYIYPRAENFTTEEYRCRSLYHSMLSILDDIVGAIVTLLKATHQWENTLLIFSGDNGGNYDLRKNAGNNFPLKGAKFSPWEGGILSTAFVSGGVLPEERRGERESGLMHVCDWWATFCEIIDVDANDSNAEIYGLPQIDSLSMWGLITEANETSPRTDIWVDNFTLINGSYKYLEGDSITFSGWTGPIYPNKSSNIQLAAPKGLAVQNCSHGCLYDIVNDRSEYNDISQENQDIAQRMKDKLSDLRPTYYSNDEVGVNSCPSPVVEPCACWMAENQWGGFLGPFQYLDNVTNVTIDDEQADVAPYFKQLTMERIVIFIVITITLMY
eukprot:154155_1